MIFISIGTANKGFDRLIKICDEIGQTHNIVFYGQIGSSTYLPKNFQYQRWLTKEEMALKYKEAQGFIIHGGFGTLSEVLRLNKPIIVVPRSFENGEAVNDQRDISQKLANLGYVKCINELTELEAEVLNIDEIRLNAYNLVSDIPNILENFLESLIHT